MLRMTIDVPQDVIDQGDVYVAMYGTQTLSGTPPTTQYAYFDGTAFQTVDGTVPAFATYSAPGRYQVDLPAASISAGEIIFGVGALPPIPMNSAGAPVQPTPATVPSGIYDFVEISYTQTEGDAASVTVDTTMLDQFGIPIQLQIHPVQPSLPHGAGVYRARAEVFRAFGEYMGQNGEAFVQCAQDPFGNPLTDRILSPGDCLLYNSVQGVQAAPTSTYEPPPAPTSTLTPLTTYYYGVTALPQGAGVESYCQPVIVQATPTATEPYVLVQWGAVQPNVPTPIASFNVYRGTLVSGALQWALLGNVPGSGGGSWTDDGSDAGPGSGFGRTNPTGALPFPVNPLANFLDAQIADVYTTFTSDSPLVLTATDGTGNGCVYTLSGQGVADDQGQPVYLQLSITSVTAAQPGMPAPLAVGTEFLVYAPFWNTNSFNPSLPGPPVANDASPTFELYSTIPASVMAFAAEGVFADSGYQPVPAGQYATLLGSVENQIVSAITRGIATTLAPQDWAAAPTQVAPTLSADAGQLTPGQRYHYVVTSVTGGSETTGSLEFHATPTEAQPSVAVNWLPLNNVDSFNVYRGTASQKQNVLVASVVNGTPNASCYVDQGGAGTPGSPPSYFPADVPSNVYDAFFHQPCITRNGAAYASPYDDQGNQSSTVSGGAVTAVHITLGPWDTPAGA
jgi:hypothetical protein